MPDDDLPAQTPPAPELRPATRRRAPKAAAAPTEAAGADATDVPTASDEDERTTPDALAPPAVAVQPPPAAPPAAAPEAAADQSPAAEGDLPVAPAKKAPAKKAPAKKAAPTTKAAETAPAKKAPAKKAPAKRAPIKKAPIKRPPSPELVAPAPAEAPTLVVAAGPDNLRLGELFASTEPPIERLRLTAGVRVLLVATVLLLAAAAGMGGAALVEQGQETWRSTLTVRLVPGPAPTGDVSAAIATARTRYADLRPGFTSAIAASAGVPSKDVRRDVSAHRLGPDELVVVADTATPLEAQSMAIRGAAAVVDGVPKDQATHVTNPADRLTALVSGYVTRAERIRPSDALAAFVAGAAAAAVLLLAGTLALLARGRDD